MIAKDRAQALAEEHHAEFLELGVYLFSTERLTGENAAIALLPTADVYRAIAAVGTAGPDAEVSNGELITWLRDLEKEQPFSITGIGRDFIEGRFFTPIRDAAALVKRINRFCRDDHEEEGQNPADDLFRRIAGQGGEGEISQKDIFGVGNSETKAQQIEDLRRSGRFFIGWD